MDFIDRENELGILRDHLKKPGASMFVLYGRRRIGKSALIGRLLEGLPRAAYHVATRSTTSDELARLSACLAVAWDIPLLEAQPLSSPAGLAALLESVREPSILVLDEFPYLAEGEPSLPGMLQASWDRRLSKGPLKLVFCGSSVSVMEGTFLSPRSPLYGRRTGQLRLGPLAAGCLKEAFRWKTPEIVELSALFGGVPGYLCRLNPELSLAENLREKVLRRGEPLYEEIPFLLREELREPRVYHSILAAMAGGARKFGEICSKAGLDRANLSRYLGTLSELGLVEREVPVTERKPDKSRNGLYRISDPFVATWFAFVHPYRDAIERGGPGPETMREILARVRDSMPRAVEPVLRGMLLDPPLSDFVPFRPAAAGRQWSREAEFDAVLLDEVRKNAFIAEFKWGSGRADPGLLDGLREKACREPAFAGMKLTFCAAARNGFSKRRKTSSDERLLDVSALKL